jgi:hypothetical protein
VLLRFVELWSSKEILKFTDGLYAALVVGRENVVVMR